MSQGERERVGARRWETLQVSLVLLLLLVVFFWKPIFLRLKLLPTDIVYTDPLYFSHAPADFVKPHNVLLYDQAYQFYPWRLYTAQALRQGFLPFWNPYVYCGTPFLAEDQPAVFCPFNLLSYILPTNDAALFTVMARLFVAGLSTYWFARTIGANRFGALVSAITFAFSGFMIVFLGHPHTNVAAWLPAFFLTTEWLCQRNSARHIALVALVIAAQLSGGHTETALYTLTAGGLYFLFRVLTGSRCSALRAPHGACAIGYSVLAFITAVVLGFALASVHVLPLWEWLRHSAEFHLRAGVENLRSWRLGPKYWLAGLLPALLPNIFGNPTWPGEYRSFMPGWNYTEQTVYVGIIGIALALAVVLVSVRRVQWREKQVLFLAVLGFATLGAALRLPVFDWINHLPLFNIASVGRFRLPYTFCMSVLAGLGAQKAVARFEKDSMLHVVVALLATAVGIGIPVLFIMRRILADMTAQVTVTPPGTLTPETILRAFQISNVMMYWPLLVALAGVFGFVLYLRRVLSTTSMQVFLLLLVVLDLFAFGINYHSTIREELIYPETPAIQALKNAPGIFRVVGTNIDLMPNTCMVHDLHDIRGLDFPIRRYMELCLAMGGQDWLGYGILFTERLQPRLLNLLNVKYVLTSSRLDPEVLHDMTLLTKDRYIKVYQNNACLPRSFIVHRVRVAANGEQALTMLQDPEFDLRAEIVLEKSPPPDFGGSQGGSLEASAEIVRYEPNRVTILASTAAHGFLFLSDTYYPDWKAYVDGVDTEIYQADYAFRAVYLTTGQHTIEFVYEPRPFRLASTLSIMALLGVIVLLVLPWSRWGTASSAMSEQGTDSPIANGEGAREPTANSRKQRVLYLDTAPTVGGSVISLYELVRGLDRTRYEPVVVTYTAHEYVGRFQALGVDVLVWDALWTGAHQDGASDIASDHRPMWAGKARKSLLAQWLQRTAWGSTLYHGFGFGLLLARRVWPRARALRRIIVKKKIDFVHTNIRVGHDREGILAAKMVGIPCVCHIRDFEELNWFDRRLAGMVNAFIYISEAVRECHLKAGVPRAKGRVVYNGLDILTFSKALDTPTGRRSFHLTEDDLAVGIVGRLESWKGQEVFLRAMAIVTDALPRTKGIVVGAPVPYEPDYRDRLLALRDELGLSDRVIFSDFRPDVPMVMSALDVVVLASISPEPFGRVLIEAMAAGKPVVGTDAGATREIIEDGVQGLVVPSNDAQALASAVIRILSDPDLGMAMGQKGRARVQERFTVQQYVDGVQAVYQELRVARNE